ncbi:MAG: IMP dehydrogenase [Thermoprotei archaeon]|nr:MAG: IMP dehydrogenase [Thermoprotei archaeon]RLF19784.1 MAG: IMP dehydrogenase [Thermoprotei archaeon]
MFMRKLTEAPLALTFRDVVILPGRSPVDPKDVDVSTYVTKNYRLGIPVVSSPMDTVTEAEMAIVMAKMGGLGVLHRNCSIEEQVKMARLVKMADMDVKVVPHITMDDQVKRAIDIMERYGINIVPITDKEGTFIGVVTKVDAFLRREEEPLRKIIRKDYPCVKTGTSIEDIVNVMRDKFLTELPVISEEGELIGLITIDEIVLKGKFREPAIGRDGRLLCAAAISPFDEKRALSLDKVVDILVLDVAHFHNDKCIEAMKRLEKKLSADVIIGNIGTKSAVKDILSKLERVDGFRVGIGSGSICTTAEITGALAPTLFAVGQVADALIEEKAKVPIIADGGIRWPGDAAKAFAVGASAVMLGYVLAGCDESPSPIIEIAGVKFKYYRGMASKAAKAKRYAADRYSKVAKSIEEGIEALVKYRGSAVKVMAEFISGLKASMGYAGAKNIKDMWYKAKLALVTPLGAQERAPHSVIPLSTLGKLFMRQDLSAT